MNLPLHEFPDLLHRTWAEGLGIAASAVAGVTLVEVGGWTAISGLVGSLIAVMGFLGRMLLKAFEKSLELAEERAKSLANDLEVERAAKQLLLDEIEILRHPKDET